MVRSAIGDHTFEVKLYFSQEEVEPLELSPPVTTNVTLSLSTAPAPKARGVDIDEAEDHS